MKALPALFGVVLVAASGLLHGNWTGRWSTSGDLEAAVGRLQNVPKTVGDWELGTEQPLDERSLQIGNIAGYLNRTYKNRKTNECMTMLLLCGRPGPIAVHTPDVCYAAAGYSSGPQSEMSMDGVDAQFKWCRMSRDNLAGSSKLQIFWSWSTAGQWVTPSNPRRTFARQPFLYKLYVIHDVSSASRVVDTRSTKEFIERFLPVLKASLFNTSEAVAAAPH